MSRIVWSLGTKCLPPPTMVMIAAKKPLVVTAESTLRTTRSVVVTIESLSTEVM